MIVVLISISVIAIAIAIYTNYECKCRVEQWKGRYLHVKHERDAYIKTCDDLTFKMEYMKEEHDKTVKELEEKYKKLQMKNCEKDIENQKKGK